MKNALNFIYLYFILFPVAITYGIFICAYTAIEWTIEKSKI